MCLHATNERCDTLENKGKEQSEGEKIENCSHLRFEM